MIKNKLQTWADLSRLRRRVTETFERRSGWKGQDLRKTLDRFASLKRRDQLLLGGLLVGEAVLGKKDAPKRRSSRRVAATA